MNFYRRTLIVWLVGCFAAARLLSADDAPSPVTFSKQFSADMIITGEGGHVIKQKIFTDNGKTRMVMDAGSGPMIMIVLPDQQKIYTVMESQKMIMVMPYDSQKMDQQMALMTGLDRKYENLGPEDVEGVACIKYRFVSEEKKAYDLWVDAARKTPVKMAAEDHSFSMLFKNYQVGPQDVTLFTVPTTGYQTMTMPSMPTLPSGPAQP